MVWCSRKPSRTGHIKSSSGKKRPANSTRDSESKYRKDENKGQREDHLCHDGCSYVAGRSQHSILLLALYYQELLHRWGHEPPQLPLKMIDEIGRGLWERCYCTAELGTPPIVIKRIKSVMTRRAYSSQELKKTKLAINQPFEIAWSWVCMKSEGDTPKQGVSPGGPVGWGVHW